MNKKEKKSLREWWRKLIETNGWFSWWECVVVVDSLETVEEIFKGFDSNLESWMIEWDCAFVPRAFDDLERFDRFWTTLGVMLIVVVGGNGIVVWEITPVNVDCWGKSFKWIVVRDCTSGVTWGREIFGGTVVVVVNFFGRSSEEGFCCCCWGMNVVWLSDVWTTAVVFSAIDVDLFDKLLERFVVSLVPLVVLFKILDFDG